MRRKGKELGGSNRTETACNAGDLGLIPGSGRSPGEGNDNPLQYSCLESFMDRGAWRATVHGVAKSQTPPSRQHFLFQRDCIPDRASSICEGPGVGTLRQWLRNSQKPRVAVFQGRTKSDSMLDLFLLLWCLLPVAFVH